MPDTPPLENEAIQFDDDLRFVEELQQSDDFNAIHRVLEDNSLSDEEVLTKVPHPLVRLAFTLSTPENVEKLKSTHGEVVAARLDKVVHFLESEFSGLSSHRAALTYVKRFLARSGLSARPASVQEIVSVNHLHTWLGSPPFLFPAARLVLGGPKDEVLFDYVTGLDDLLFLIRGTARAAAELLKAAAELHRHGILMEIPQGFDATTNSIRESLEQVDRHLAALTVTPVELDVPSRTVTDPSPAR